MKAIKHNLLGVFLLSVTVMFSQSRTQKSTESFNVANDVVVEINAHQSDITVEYWDKNEVFVETILTVDGVSVEDSASYFDSWNVEALGNSKKVIVNSNPNFHHWNSDFPDMNIVISDMDFDFPDMDFDFEPVIAYALKFDSVSFPTPPKMPEIVIKHIHKIEWDQKAYEKDKEGYLKKWEEEQEVWAKEFEDKYEPQMEAYEKEMEKWGEEFEKKFEPQMKAYEKDMEKWEKDFEEKLAPKIKAHEEKMKELEKEIEKNIAPKLKEQEKHLEKLEKELVAKHEKALKMKKKITIKIPKGASVDVNTHEGSIKLPKGVKKV